MTRPILVFGAGGRVASELWKIMDPAPSGRPSMFYLQQECDITNGFAVMREIGANAPAAIINLAAATLPWAEKAENRVKADITNVVAVDWLARLSQIAGCALVHVSTDCVFNGQYRGLYQPDDPTSPVNHYGLTKRDGEEAIRRATIPHIIIRTTGVYLADKPNFLKLVLDKARAGEELTVVSDSVYTPTDARELAKAILLATERVIADPSVSGTYHFAGPDVMSYMDFADLVLEEAGLSMPIHATTMAEREKIEGFKRPKNAALNSDKFAETFGMRHRPTRECVRELVKPR